MYSSFQLKQYAITDENKIKFCCTIDEKEYPHLTVHLAEIILTQDPRALNLDKTKQNEIEGLLGRKT